MILGLTWQTVCVVNPDFLSGMATQVGQKNVSPGQKALEYFTALFTGDIQADTALVAVGRLKNNPLVVGHFKIKTGDTRPEPQRICRVTFNFDHVRTQIPQYGIAAGPGVESSVFDNSDAVKRPGLFVTRIQIGHQVSPLSSVINQQLSIRTTRN